MKLYERIKQNLNIKKGIVFAISISIIWPIISWLFFYPFDTIKTNLIDFGFLYIALDLISTLIFLAPFYIETNFFSVFKAWILIRFAVFAIFGYYNGLLYQKLSLKFKYTKTYLIVTSLIFYYIMLGILQLIGVIFYGGLP